MKKIYEVNRTIFCCKSKTIAKAIRKKAFLVGIENPTEKQIDKAKIEQTKFIEALRENMKDGEVLESIKEYKSKRMTVIPTDFDLTKFLLIFFDIDTNFEIIKSKVKYDEDKDLFYIEIEEE